MRLYTQYVGIQHFYLSPKLFGAVKKEVNVEIFTEEQFCLTWDIPQQFVQLSN